MPENKNSTVKKKPERTCLNCGNKFLKEDLVRIVINADWTGIDLTSRKNGRGAYVCRSCIQSKIKKKSLSRAFKDLNEEEINFLLEELEKLGK